MLPQIYLLYGLWQYFHSTSFCPNYMEWDTIPITPRLYPYTITNPFKGGECMSEAYGLGGGFALIVVLFILLIIVGSAYVGFV